MKALFFRPSLLAAVALASDAALGAQAPEVLGGAEDEPADGVNEMQTVESVKASFFAIGKAALAAELEPLRTWGARALSSEAALVANSIDRAGTALLTHVMNALHPYGMDQAVQIAAAKAAQDAAALAAADQQHAASVALEANGGVPVPEAPTLAQDAAQIVGDVVDAVDPALAPAIAVGEAVVDPLLGGQSAGPQSSGTLSESTAGSAGSNGGEGPLPVGSAETLTASSASSPAGAPPFVGTPTSSLSSPEQGELNLGGVQGSPVSPVQPQG